MKLLAAAALLVLAGATIVRATLDFDVDLASHLEHFSTQRYPNEKYNDGRLQAQTYIKERFINYGLKVFEHKFNTTVALDPLGIENKYETVEGVNIIGLAEAVSNKPGAVLLVGADYDTNGLDEPMFTNGAGVAAMLEVARLFMHNTRWTGLYWQNFTTIFVAFDLNTREHQVSPGVPGARHFITDYLWSYLNKSDTNFGGAFILDSIMNVNYNEGSQTVDDSFQKMFPDTYQRVINGGKKGDFLSAITLTGTKSDMLQSQFTGSYHKDRRLSMYRLESMKINKEAPLGRLIKELTKPSSIHFWTFTANNTETSLPAILLTDTQGLRQMPPPPEICFKACPAKEWLTQDRIDFMDTTVRALTRTLMSRQGIQLPQSDAGVTSLPSLVMTLMIVLIVRIYQ